ncbi:type IV pilin protein [Wenyingzhuangia sp. IMCC45533]
MKKINAFNLQELLVVLVIMGILLLLAVPNLMPLITKTKSMEAQTQLKHLYTLEKQHFYLHSTYSDDFSQLGFEAPKSITKGGNANYEYSVQKTASGFVAKATAVVDFDGDGVFNQWQVDHQEVLKETTKD